jgi:hypothetical protein
MADAGLHDSLAVLELRHQHEECVEVIGVETVRADRDDSSEQQGAEPGRWVHGEDPVPERDAPSRRVNATVEHLELRQDHRLVKLLATASRHRLGVASSSG